ncbi:MAG: hypothetical protein ACLFWR_10145 [Acidimicrobiales bacterium]
MRRTIAAVTLAAGVLAGAVGASALSPVGLVDAAESEEPPAESADRPLAAWIAETLAPLVDDGTIDQQQADAVQEALIDAAPRRGPGPGHGPGFAHRPALERVAEHLGLSVEEVRSALREGTTIPELAEQQGVELDPPPRRGLRSR